MEQRRGQGQPEYTSAYRCPAEGYDPLDALSESEISGTTEFIVDKGAYGEVFLRELYTDAAPEELPVDFPNAHKLYLRDARTKPPASQERTNYLAARMEQGDPNAAQRIAETNLGLSIFWAEKRVGQGVPLLDLIQEANKGLLRAIETYDYHRGWQFSTYAGWWIRQALHTAVAENVQRVHVPLHVGQDVARCKQYMLDFYQENGVELSLEEACHDLELKQHLIIDALHASDVISYNRPANELEPEDDIINSLPDGDSVDPTADAVIQSIDADGLPQLIDGLRTRFSRQEWNVLRLRFGIGEDMPRTHQEIGEILKITLPAVRNTLTRAMVKLRHPNVIKKLRDYL